MNKKFISLMLAFLMLVTMMPINNVFAEDVLTEADKFQEEVETINAEFNVIIANTTYKDAITNLPDDILEWDIKEPANATIRGNQEAIVTITFKDGSVKDIVVPVTVGESIPNVFQANEDGTRPDEVPDYYVEVTVDPVLKGLKSFNTRVYYVNPYVTVEIPYIEDTYKRGTEYVGHKDYKNSINDAYFNKPDPSHERWKLGFAEIKHLFYFDAPLVQKFTEDTTIQSKYIKSLPLVLNYSEKFNVDNFKNLFEDDSDYLINKNEYLNNAELIYPMPKYGFEMMEEKGNGYYGLTEDKIKESEKLAPFPLYINPAITFHSFVNTPNKENKQTHFFHTVGVVYVGDVVVAKENRHPDYYKLIEFKSDNNGNLESYKAKNGYDYGFKFWVNPNVEIDLTEITPKVTANQGYNFDGWDKDLKATFTEDTVINAKYSETPFDKENVIKMELVGEHEKMEYASGDALNLSGLKIKLTDKNNKEQIVEAKDLSNYGITTNPVANTKLTLSDNGKSIVVSKEGFDNLETKSKLIVKEGLLVLVKPEKTKVDDKNNLTDEEKNKVKDEIIKANKDIKRDEITVNNDGSVTINHNEKIGALTQDDTVIQKIVEDNRHDNEKYPVMKPNKTEVVNKDALIKEEKDKVAKEVKKSNPNAKDVEVKDNGDTVITYPDGSINELKQIDTVIQKEVKDNRKDNEKYPAVKPNKTGVNNMDKLTLLEKIKVEEEVKKSNPYAVKVYVKDNGDVTLIYLDKSTNELKQKDTVYELKEEKEISRKPFVDRVHEGDEYITGKGQANSQIDIKLPNGKYLYGITDKHGDFRIKITHKLSKDDIIYTIQTEFNKKPSEPVKDYIYGPVKNSVKEKLKTEQHYSYIVGYPDGRFGTADSITRAQVAMIFARLSRDQYVSPSVKFSDVKPDSWYYKAVGIGVQQGFIKGYEDGTFRPDEPITRAEFASVVASYAEREAMRQKFSDVSGWATGAINTAYVNGWMNGYSKYSFKPDIYIPRCEAVAVIDRMLGRNPDKDFIDKYIPTLGYKDVPKYTVFYDEIYSASWGHDYVVEDGVEKWTRLNGKSFEIK